MSLLFANGLKHLLPADNVTVFWEAMNRANRVREDEAR